MLVFDVATSHPEAVLPLKLRLKPSPGELRKKHIGYESSVRGLAFLLFAIGVFFCMAAAVAYLSPRTTGFYSALIYLPVGLVHLALGFGMKDFSPIARGGAILGGLAGMPFSIFVLSLEPVASPAFFAMSSGVLYLMWNRKSAVVFSPRYLEVIKGTPEILPKTSFLAWVGLVLLIAGTLILMVAMAETIWENRFQPEYAGLILLT